MEGNKTIEINKRGKGGKRGKEKLGLKGVKRKSFNNHPYNQQLRPLIQLKPNHKPKECFGEFLRGKNQHNPEIW